MTKTDTLSEVNGYLPARTGQYETGWVTKSYFYGHPGDRPPSIIISEAAAFKLLGEALEHQDNLTKAIANLRALLSNG